MTNIIETIDTIRDCVANVKNQSSHMARQCIRGAHDSYLLMDRASVDLLALRDIFVGFNITTLPNTIPPGYVPSRNLMREMLKIYKDANGYNFNIVQPIKTLREETKCGLKEAKDYIENWFAKNNP